MAYDVRSVANFVLDQADQHGVRLTNIDVNKIVYFVHGWYLAKFDRPLVNAKIEAWTYGPVFRELYAEFKNNGSEAIQNRATRVNPANCEREVCHYQFPVEEEAFLRELIIRYVKMKTRALVQLSHANGGPWDQVFNHSGETNPGMEISDALIKAFFAEQTRH